MSGTTVYLTCITSGTVYCSTIACFFCEVLHEISIPIPNRAAQSFMHSSQPLKCSDKCSSNTVTRTVLHLRNRMHGMSCSYLPQSSSKHQQYINCRLVFTAEIMDHLSLATINPLQFQSPPWVIKMHLELLTLLTLLPLPYLPRDNHRDSIMITRRLGKGLSSRVSVKCLEFLLQHVFPHHGEFPPRLTTKRHHDSRLLRYCTMISILLVLWSPWPEFKFSKGRL